MNGQMQIVGAGPSAPVVATTTAHLEAGRFYTLVIVGNAAAPAKVEAFLIEDALIAVRKRTRHPRHPDRGHRDRRYRDRRQLQALEPRLHDWVTSNLSKSLDSEIELGEVHLIWIPLRLHAKNLT